MSRRSHLVLVVEDDPHDARLIDIALTSSQAAHFKVAVVERLSRACEWLNEHEPDVVLADLSLPDSRGIETFEALYGHRPDVPMIVLSGLADENLALTAVQSGAQDYLVKSHDSPDSMVRAVLYAIERFRVNRSLRQREEHLRLLTEQLPCAFWTTDTHLRLTSCAGQEILGTFFSRCEGRHLSEIFPRGQTDTDLLALHQQAAQGQSQTLDFHRPSQVFHVHIEPFRQRDGRIIGTIGVALDITDQKLIDLERRVTRQIQEGLQPAAAPPLRGFDLAGASRSAAEAGGDYFDYFPMCDGATAVAVADVAGHGLGPAMMMCHTRAYVRALALHNDHPAEILKRVNAFLCHDAGEERLVALFLAKLNVARRVMQYANAGHRGYLFRGGAAPELLAPTAIPLNVTPDYQVETAPEIPLVPGDVVLLYTDGVIEATSATGEAFGPERMLQLVAACREQSARAIVDRLFEDVQAFAATGRCEDDMTAVIIKHTA
jgi:PAS domain S-box-containing protein